MKTQLFCIPYAGGSATVFDSWKLHLDSNIKLLPIELAGRGIRINEPLYTKRSDAVNDVFELIKDKIVQSPYMIFGHSMGAFIAYELVQKIKKNSLPQPIQVFFSGTGAPHLKDKGKKYHLLEEDKFKHEILELGGTSPELFEYPELMDVFLPLLKNDFRMVETDIPDTDICPLDQDIMILFGKEDTQTPEQLEGWKSYTTKTCDYYGFSGGHFFIVDEKIKVIDVINKTYTATNFNDVG